MRLSGPGRALNPLIVAFVTIGDRIDQSSDRSKPKLKNHASQVPEQLGALLRRSRMLGNLAQSEMAAHLEIGLSTYRKMESGDDGVALRFWVKAWSFMADSSLSRAIGRVVAGCGLEGEAHAPGKRRRRPLIKIAHPDKAGFGRENAWIGADSAKNATLIWPEESCDEFQL